MEELLRPARNEDKHKLKKIWKRTFGDSSSFIDWFFDNRFLPEYSIVLEIDGIIASCVHSLPLHVNVRDSILPCSILAGVSTLSEYCKRGYMHMVMQYFMNKMHNEGIALVPHRPASLQTFFSLGHYPVSDTQYITLSKTAKRAVSDSCVDFDIKQNYSALYTAYSEYSKRYSGMICRSYSDFVLKCNDYLSCNAKCVVYEEFGNVLGYCIYFDDGANICGEEFTAINAQTYNNLYAAMQVRSKNKNLKIRMASDIKISNCGANIEILQKSVMGAANISSIMKVFNISDYAIQITDEVVKMNAGIYNLKGERVDKKPQIRMSAGRFTQWAVGYRNLNEIYNAGEAEIFDMPVLRELEKIKKCNCFIIDEY